METSILTAQLTSCIERKSSLTSRLAKEEIRRQAAIKIYFDRHGYEDTRGDTRQVIGSQGT